MIVTASLDSRLSIINLVNHFSTHLWTGKRESYDYTFALIISFLVHHLCAYSPSSLSPCTCDLMAITIMLLAPSSHVLLRLTQFTWHDDISNLVSLITKTKLRLLEGLLFNPPCAQKIGTGMLESNSTMRRECSVLCLVHKVEGKHTFLIVMWGGKRRVEDEPQRREALSVTSNCCYKHVSY
jgi:hypothetical protein